MHWHAGVDKIAPHIFKIESPSGHGTGFLCFFNKSVAAIATAAHVVNDANKWQQPIRVSNYQLQDTILLNATDRVILESDLRDSAAILFHPGELKLPESTIPLLPEESVLRIGVEVGWVGFPAVEQNTLCFFSGNISAHIQNQGSYLIDGVAINGVSGGPVFDCNDDGSALRIIGVITAYIANRATGTTLPGLALAQAVSHFHSVISNLNSLQEAMDKKKELETEIRQPPETESPQLPLPNTDIRN